MCVRRLLQEARARQLEAEAESLKPKEEEAPKPAVYDWKAKMEERKAKELEKKLENEFPSLSGDRYV
jgi:hypothetical protein